MFYMWSISFMALLSVHVFVKMLFSTKMYHSFCFPLFPVTLQLNSQMKARMTCGKTANWYCTACHLISWHSPCTEVEKYIDQDSISVRRKRKSGVISIIIIYWNMRKNSISLRETLPGSGTDQKWSECGQNVIRGTKVIDKQKWK